MKATYKFIIAALAATLAMTSCTQDYLADSNGNTPQSKGTRTIAVSFGQQTRTALGYKGITPEFRDGDMIIVSNGKEWVKLPVTVDDNGAYFTTDLEGSLKAVYPANAAKLEGTEIVDVIVPSNQTGRFADANIAMATIEDGETRALFRNQTAILKFYVDRSIGVTGIRINDIRGFLPEQEINYICDGFVDENGNLIEKKVSDDEYSNEYPIDYRTQITVESPEISESPDRQTLDQLTDDPGHRICYVAIRPTTGDQTYSLEVISGTKTQTQDINSDVLASNNAKPGITEKQTSVGSVNKRFIGVSVPANKMLNVFMPYYIEVNVGTDDEPVYQYWSYCNLGAFLPEESGYYYSWGNIEGHWKNGVSDGYTFSSGAYSGERYQTMSSIGTPGSCLTGDITSEYDAAYEALGGKWRMPTKSECGKLISGKSITANNFTVGKGLLIPDSPLLFPCIGSFNEYGNALQYNDEFSFIWTSSISETGYAYGFRAGQNGVVTQSFPRFSGFPIRPIYGDPVIEDTQISIDSYEEGGNI